MTQSGARGALSNAIALFLVSAGAIACGQNGTAPSGASVTDAGGTVVTDSSAPTSTESGTEAPDSTSIAFDSGIESGAPVPDAGGDAGAPVRIEAWIYPGDPACNASAEYADGRHIDVLKPQYYKVTDTGDLAQMTVASDGCNGYSAANAADVKAHSVHQLVTVSANGAQIGAVAGDATKSATAVSTLVGFVQQVGFTGVDIDFEGISSTDYPAFLSFLKALGDALHAKGLLLEVDGTAYASDADLTKDALRYEDLVALPVDGMVVMAYDYMTDYSKNGAGDPIAPNAWVGAVMDYTLAKVKDPSRIVIGMPSYGYSGATGGFTVARTPSSQILALPGASAAKPFPDAFEMTWASASQGTSYVYVDSPGLDAKRAFIAGKGAQAISVWHLGGNAWFSK
jgi:spore germination protein YaaH